MDLPSGQLEQHISPGDVLVNRYEVIRVIGSGCMGVVYQCRDRNAGGHNLAIKVLFAEVAKDKDALERFKNEVIACQQIVHRNVVQSFDYVSDGDIYAYTMEYIEGYTLDRLTNSRDLLPIPVVVEILVQVCQGLQAVHDAGIVHRDLKPENIIVSANGDVKIMDFGIARSESGKRLTAHGSLLGTLEYMSPEYLSEGTVHPLCDLYSLGIIAYQLVTGRLPHLGNTLIQTLRAKIETDPPSPRSFRSDCPNVLSQVVLKALCRTPAGRVQSAREFTEVLLSLGLSKSEKSSSKVTLELNAASQDIRAKTRPEAAPSSERPRETQLLRPSVRGTLVRKRSLKSKRRERRRRAILWFVTTLIITFCVIALGILMRSS